MVVGVVVTMFAPIIDTVDPMMVFIPVTRSPYHFVVMVPVSGAMRVIRLVSYLDFHVLRSHSGR